MSTLKSVFKKVSNIEKVELSEAERVELGLTQDAITYIKTATKLIQDIEKDGREWLVLDRRIKGNGESLVSTVYDVLDSTKRKIEIAYKQLGINDSPEIARIDKVLNDIRTVRKKYGF